MVKIPAGLTSSVTADAKNFILQTEFTFPSTGKRPNEFDPNATGHIKTTVAVEGQVVHKVDKTYRELFDTEEAFILAEKAVKQQHLAVARQVVSKPKEFLASVSELTISGEDRLGLIPGIADVVQIDWNNLSNQPQQAGIHNNMLKNLELTRDLVFAVTQNTKLGKLKRMVGTIEDKKFMLVGYGGHSYYLNLRENADVSSVLAELDKVRS
jgi:hypothetical protein